MHNTVLNLLKISKEVKKKFESNTNLIKSPEIIAVSKTFSLNKILPLIDHGHLDYGENKVQEAIEKWSDIKLTKNESFDLQINNLVKYKDNQNLSEIIENFQRVLDSEPFIKKYEM